ncbi:hypothetical protein GCM10027580_14520 [Corynebacterium faecale]
MSDGDVTMEGLQDRLIEYLGHQAEILEHQNLFAIAHCDAGSFLATVLEGEKPEISKFGYLFTRCPDAKHSAFLTRGLFILIIVGVVLLVHQRTRELVLIKLCHRPKS